MQKNIERVILALIMVALVISVIGLVTQSTKVTNAGLIVLIVVALIYAAVQVAAYVLNNNAKEEKKTLVYALATSLVAISIMVVGTLMLTGRLF